MTALAIAGVGVYAPGLADWRETQAVLRGTAQHCPQPLPKLSAALLPPTERRRANEMAHLAIHVATQAVMELPAETLAHLPAVFSSADGDGRVLGEMLEALAKTNVALSPTLFHNSVFNAPAGYWSIGSRCEAAATTLCAGAASFAAGLIEAYTQACTSNMQVLYVAFDSTFPVSLRAFAVDRQPFACALLLGPAATAPATLGAIDGWTMSANRGATATPYPALADFFAGNPAAAALPLLAAIARREAVLVRLPYLDDAALELAYTP
jgi:Beta-ketoacyl synthase, N-terminal domain